MRLPRISIGRQKVSVAAKARRRKVEAGTWLKMGIMKYTVQDMVNGMIGTKTRVRRPAGGKIESSERAYESRG